MPIYEFKCSICNLDFEDIINYSDIKNERCPNCGCSVDKKISKPNIKIQSEFTSNVKGNCVRIPEYKDDKTGMVGLGRAELGKI